ncbi:glutamine amidotransferase [Uliginosibacterium sp. H1]|uniref:glutamine amidotransferase n=1 Tax=Uliginosibacterium sp. H1 TaxID=3114757 RepID=UPI002E19D84B|nr:glutamine amidotransferase [Uliginosibacterium sp. H1]
MKTALVLRHLAFEDLGLLAPLLTARGYALRYHDLGVDDLAAVEPLADSLMVVLGGPIGAEDDALYPFLTRERAVIRARLDAGRPTLGICLGAQLMASALGAPVRPMGVKEIGFAPVEITAAGLATPLRHLQGVAVLHWHGDQFGLPEGSPSLAATGVCPHQAFMVGRHGLGLQFHAEADWRRIEQWLIGHTGELGQAGIDIAALRAEAQRCGPLLEPALQALMDDWLGALE